MSRQQDEEHLKLLSTFHYVLAGLLALFGSFPLIHVAMGAAMLNGDFGGPGGPPPVMGLMFLLMGSVFVLFGWTLAVLAFLAARRLSWRRSYMFCFIVACIECAYMPFGTVLGVLTIIILNKPSVKGLFAVTGREPAPGASRVQTPDVPQPPLPSERQPVNQPGPRPPAQ